MRSVQLVARRTLEVRDTAGPEEPGPGEVLVRIHAVGVCGSDLHWYLDGRIGATPAVFPQVLGHEPAGVVVAAGKDVTSLRAGDHVALEPAITCGHCEPCRTGRHNNCLTSIFMGSPQRPGLFREFAVVPERNAVRIPEDMDFVEATVIEPLAVILHVQELAPVRLGDVVAVIGAGPIGLLTAAAARIAGAAQVIVADKVEHRVRLAREMGADVAVNTRQASFAGAVLDVTRGRGADVVFDAAATLDTTNASFAAARAGGTVVLIGIPSEQRLDLDLHVAMNKELNLQTIKRSNHTAHPALALLRAGKVDARIVTHRYPLERTPEAFATLADYADGIVKAVIEI